LLSRLAALDFAAVSVGLSGVKKMAEKKELIFLDARIESVIDDHAFRAVLSNGHEITAFTTRAGTGPGGWHAGETVKVEMSPFDMSKGCIIKKSIGSES